MYVCFVKHGNSQKEFLFECTNLHDSIKCGTAVICDTMYGNAVGVATTDPIRVQSSDGSIATLIRTCGAYLPLKPIIGIQPQLSETEKENIAKEWLANKFGCDKNELPF